MRPSEQQIRYQRNMLIGLIMAVALSLGFGVWVRSLDGPALMINSLLTLPNLVILDHELVEHSDEPARLAVGGMNPYSNAHDGFLGFVNLRPEPLAPELIAKRPVVYIQDFAPMSDDSAPSFSTIAGTEQGLFLPEEYSTANAHLPPEDIRPPVTRQIQVLYKLDPEYPWVAREAGKEGLVVVLVYVDSTGGLSTFPSWVEGEGIQTLRYTVAGRRKVLNYAVKEDPPDWFFAHNLLKVLSNWMFSPRVENGRAVNSMLLIKFRFCLGQGCIRYELEQLGY